MVEQIVAQNDYKREALQLLKKKSFGHVKVFKPLFLIKTGLKQDMNRFCLCRLGELRRHHRDRLLAKWLSMVVHPCSNLRLCSSPEL
ncbi:hypothetical protein C2845_PM06G26610 [Panicum miliaceum]|uniref:Uncharacterized protein n=1 Tax=Panicum miliaceum TaxID=4540 RepID=A0A3L6RDH5_PANMI|nr:hypothetical protein C2845_PM06G26610 [Panicum miliaceum]